MKNLLLFLILISSFSGCIINSHIDYIGPVYDKSENTPIIFSPEDIPGNYEKMGNGFVYSEVFVNMNVLYNKISRKGRKIGADLALIKSYDYYLGGSLRKDTGIDSVSIDSTPHNHITIECGEKKIIEVVYFRKKE